MRNPACQRIDPKLETRTILNNQAIRAELALLDKTEAHLVDIDFNTIALLSKLTAVVGNYIHTQSYNNLINTAFAHKKHTVAFKLF